MVPKKCFGFNVSVRAVVSWLWPLILKTNYFGICRYLLDSPKWPVWGYFAIIAKIEGSWYPISYRKGLQCVKWVTLCFNLFLRVLRSCFWLSIFIKQLFLHFSIVPDFPKMVIFGYFAIGAKVMGSTDWYDFA